MEKQKEKKIKVSKLTSSFPIDLTSEILIRLPEESIARLRFVSMVWLSITTDPYFIKMFEKRYPRSCLLVCYIEQNKLFVSSVPQHYHSLSKYIRFYYSRPKHVNLYHFKSPLIYGLPCPEYFHPTESVQGFFCFQDSATPIVCNPSTREILALPKPRMSWENLTLYLGYDPVEGKHKVTLGSGQESWRTVKTKLTHRSDGYSTCGRCIKGVIYYLAYVYHTSVWVIMSFDVRSETF
ncbi:hypothetical protein CARUB_v100126090mg, partial [Capsella rubella]